MHRPHPARRRRAALAAAGLLATVLVTGCGDSGSTELAAGGSTAGPGGVEGDTFDVRVPSGALTVTVGEPVATITSGSQELTAPAGGALVPVSWSLDRFQTSEVTGFDEETELALVVDGEPTTVTSVPDAPTSATGSRIVSIPEDGEVDTVLATYAGLEQRIHLDGTREAGVAEALYEPAADGEREDCSEGWDSAPRAGLDIECTLRVWTLPYLPDAGWAEAGSTHLVVEPDLTLVTVTDAGEEYRATFSAATGEVGGATVDAPFEEGTGGPASVAVRMVSDDMALPSDWQLEATFDLRSRAARGRLDGTTLTLTGGGRID